ncbi:MAG: hypothetical protein HRT69_08220 [Flavobacteriaceae bacterium]|nr:hypothetical protein [Flavobacteriaceae bacterium]
MKKLKTILNIVFIVTTLLFISCGNDDDAVIVANNEISVQDLAVAIDENPTVGQVIGTVVTTQTIGGGSLVYSITTQTSTGALNIDASTGELTVADATLFDFETTPVLTATVSVDGAANNATVTININNLSEVNVQDFTTVIDENPTNGDAVGTVQATGDGTLTYSITTQTPAGALGIDANTGELTVTDATLFDFETNPTITADILVDNSGTTETITATINLNNVNELSIQDFTTAIDENPTNGDSLGTVQANGDGTLSYSIISQTPTGALSINASTGELTVTDATLFDFETNPTITANISVDNSVSTETSVITINLNDLTEPAAIGDFRDGGVVFWIDPTDNTHGMVCAVSNQFISGVWGCDSISVGTDSVIGSGATNTVAIEAACTTVGTVVDQIANLSLNGYDDWFLPSEDELYAMYLNIGIVNTEIAANGGQITYQFHWSSTEINTSSARFVNLTTGVLAGGGKDGNSYFARAVRAF